MTEREAPPPGWVQLTIVLLGVAATAFGVAISLVEAPEDRWLPAAVLHGALVAAPLTVGLIALRVRAAGRFAWCLIGSAAVFSLSALAESRNPDVYAIGRTAVWFSEVTVVFLLLSFPSGRLTDRGSRVVFWVLTATVFLLYLPGTLLDQEYPTPSPFSTCRGDCPHNAFALTSSTPAFFHDVVRPGRELITVALLLAVIVILVRRANRAGPLLRRALQPIIVVSVLRIVVLVVYFPTRRSGNVGVVTDALGWLWGITVAVVAVSFGAGLLARRLHAASALHRLALQLHPDLAQARNAMASALEDPSLHLCYRIGDSGLDWIGGTGLDWVDDMGALTSRPPVAPGRRLTEVGTQDGEHALAVLHDPAAGQDPMVVRTAASYVLVAIENASLLDQLRTSVDDLADSRARLIDNADAVRRSIERDLHDGGQQRLTALRMRIAITAEKLESASPDDAERIRRLGDDVNEAIDEIRRLARGIYPSALTDHGLGAALRAAARTSPVHVSVDVDGIGRLAPEIERAVYFVCTEAMQNAVKHANGLSWIQVRVRRTDAGIGFAVEDDGSGFEVGLATTGSGLPNMTDRIAASGGTVVVDSQSGGGTVISGTIPIR